MNNLTRRSRCYVRLTLLAPWIICLTAIPIAFGQIKTTNHRRQFLNTLSPKLPLKERLYNDGVESGKSDAEAGVKLKASLVMDQPTALLYMMAPPPPQKKPLSYYDDIRRVTLTPKDQQKVLIGSFLSGYKLGYSKKPPKVRYTVRLALQHLGADVLLYAIDYGNRLPSIRTLPEARTVLSTYLDPSDTFVNPQTGKEFILNPGLSGKLITSFAQPQDTFIFCTSDALPGQGHEAVMLDGKVRLLSKREWVAIKKLLFLPREHVYVRRAAGEETRSFTLRSDGTVLYGTGGSNGIRHRFLAGTYRIRGKTIILNEYDKRNPFGDEWHQTELPYSETAIGGIGKIYRRWHVPNCR